MQKKQIEKYLLRISSKDVAPSNSTFLSKFSSFYDVLTKYFYQNLKTPYLCVFDIYPLAVSKGFKTKWKSYYKKKYNYHGVNGMVSRTLSSDDATSNSSHVRKELVANKTISNVGEL